MDPTGLSLSLSLCMIPSKYRQVYASESVLYREVSSIGNVHLPSVPLFLPLPWLPGPLSSAEGFVCSADEVHLTEIVAAKELVNGRIDHGQHVKELREGEIEKE